MKTTRTRPAAFPWLSVVLTAAGLVAAAGCVTQSHPSESDEAAAAPGTDSGVFLRDAGTTPAPSTDAGLGSPAVDSGSLLRPDAGAGPTPTGQCSAEEIEPILTCAQDECGVTLDLDGGVPDPTFIEPSALQCIRTSCASEVFSVSPTCLACLAAAMNGGNPMGVIQSCLGGI